MEVTIRGSVARPPHYFYGWRTHAEHEQFPIRTAGGEVQVIDNVTIAPRLAVQTGDDVTVHGDLVHDPGREPIVHWTHHDPSRRHEDGYIEWRGRVYA